MQKIKVESFASEAMKALQEQYKYISGTVVKKAIVKTAEETAEEVSRNAPRRSGEYAASWTSGYMKKKGEKTSMYVYAESPHYRLPHLLEREHALRNGGRSKPKEHIKPAADKIGDKMVEAIKEELR